MDILMASLWLLPQRQRWTWLAASRGTETPQARHQKISSGNPIPLSIGEAATPWSEASVQAPRERADAIRVVGNILGTSLFHWSPQL